MNELDTSSGQGRALLVVEPAFASEHVGVRRVVANYWDRLLRLGHQVDLAIVQEGKLWLVSREVAASTFRIVTTRSRGISTPAWPPAHEHRRRFLARRAVETVPEQPVDLRTALIDVCYASDYEVSVVTNPWLCDQPMGNETFTHGIVYDLVPNLLVAQALNFGAPTHDFGHFSYAHHRGYQFYLDTVDTILCISQSTRADFLRFYEPDDVRRVIVDIPFDFERFVGPGVPVPAWSSGPQGAQRNRVLLVNVLDPRKNIDNVTRALGSITRDTPIDITVVGRERLDRTRAEDYLKLLGENGAQVAWHRDASDELLISLYAAADLLVFPSLYEGLGLPVLEAQSLGTPVVSSSGSSLGEVNFNQSLLVDPGDWRDIKEKVTAQLDGHSPSVRGKELTDRVQDFLNLNHRFEETVVSSVGVGGTGGRRQRAD